MKVLGGVYTVIMDLKVIGVGLLNLAVAVMNGVASILGMKRTVVI